MSKQGDDDLTPLKQALAEGGSTRSPLLRWLVNHHDGLVELLGFERPNWDVVARSLSEDYGIRKPDGGAYTGPSVRRRWYEAQAIVARRRTQRPADPAGPSLPQVRLLNQPAPPEPPGRDSDRSAGPRPSGLADLARQLEKGETPPRKGRVD